MAVSSALVATALTVEQEVILELGGPLRRHTGRGLAAEGSTTMADTRRGTKTASARDGHHAEATRPGPDQRAAAGKAARATAPLEAHAEFRPAKSRDPVGLLLGQAKTRVPELVPIRHGRMLVSPFAFYRGAALVMAADLHTTPTPELRVQLCGDAHLSNFGAYA